MRRTEAQWPRLATLYGSGPGFGAGVVAAIVAATLGGGLIAPILVVTAVSTVTTFAGAAAAGGQCWLLYASFVLGRAGDLNLDNASLDAAAVLGCTALLATVFSAVARRLWPRRPALVPLPRRAIEQTTVDRWSARA